MAGSMNAPEISGLQRVAIAPSQKQDDRLLLSHDQAHYLGRVLRLRVGDRFIAMDGQGNWWLATWQGEAIAQIDQEMAVTTELPIPIVLMVAMPKGNGMDEIVRQTTEIGVAEIFPVMSERTLLQPSPNKVERWRRIATEAAEQSERQLIPKIYEPQVWEAALEKLLAGPGGDENEPPASEKRAIARFICTARQGTLLNEAFSQTFSYPQQPRQIIVASGPEGGWTEAEVEQAIAYSFIPISLGRRILRATTAPVAVTALIAHYIESSGWLNHQ